MGGFGSIQIGLSGMLAFQRALDVISNNVSNLNTPGFKLDTLEFRDLFYTHSSMGDTGRGRTSLELGSGVSAPSSSTRFTQGEVRETGTGTDVAIDGNGFFVIREGDHYVYTRAGQFQFSDDGFLTTSTGQHVSAIDSHGTLVDLTLGDLGISPAKATSIIHLVDNLSTGSTEHSIPDIEIRDALGESHKVTLVFTRSQDTAGSWQVEVRNSDGSVIADAGEVRFSGNGSPLEGFNQVSFLYSPAGAPPMDVTIDMGTPGTFTGATSFSGGTTSTLKVGSQDGVAAGSIVKLSFDEDGVLQLQYSNGQTRSGPRLALAWFEDLQSLDHLEGALFRAPEDARPILAGANEGVMGRIRGGNVEISNVELTEQFTDLIIVQRGFQASSQILTTANEMMQEIIESTRSRK